MGPGGQMGAQRMPPPPQLPSPQAAKADLTNKTTAFLAQGDQMADMLTQFLGVQNIRQLFHSHNQEILALLDDLLKKMDPNQYIKDLDLFQDHTILIADAIFHAMSNSSSSQQGQTGQQTVQTQSGQMGGQGQMSGQTAGGKKGGKKKGQQVGH